MSRRTRREAADRERQQYIEDRDTARELAEERLRTIGRLSGTITDLRSELAKAKTPPAGWLAERRELKRCLLLLAQGRRRDADIIVELQAANDALNREAVDRAGTLAKREVAA